MRKICVVVTARTSYTKIQPILKALQKLPQVKTQIICAGSSILEKYGQVEKTIEKDGFNVDAEVHFILEGQTLLTSVKSAGLAVIEMSAAFDRLKPDLVMVMADRYEILPIAMAVTYLNIPLAHVQGGEISGNIDEKVRHAVTKLADFHFPATAAARDRIIAMGEKPESVFLTGCPSIDIARKVIEKPDFDFDLYQKYGGVGGRPDLSSGFSILMQHPVTYEPEQAFEQIQESLYALHEWGRPALCFWPNPDGGSDLTSKGIRAFREKYNPQKMHFIKNMEPLDFLRLLNKSSGILGNSSVAIREACFLGVPAINLGNRQANRDRGANVIDLPHDRDAILKALPKHFSQRFPHDLMYGDGNAGEKIAKIMADIQMHNTKTLAFAGEA
jgi:UDP-hydrolysing UDP-N-acetyl-D-glucosamine 2-epimerase